jgi:hypothetical protein
MAREGIESMYFLTVNGYRITAPMKLNALITRFGPVKELESKGFLVVQLK